MQKTVVFHSCSVDQGSMSLLVQFIDGFGRPCASAVTFGLLLEVPQSQSIARACGHSSCRDWVRLVSGGDVGG